MRTLSIMMTAGWTETSLARALLAEFDSATHVTVFPAAPPFVEPCSGIGGRPGRRGLAWTWRAAFAPGVADDTADTRRIYVTPETGLAQLHQANLYPDPAVLAKRLAAASGYPAAGPAAAGPAAATATVVSGGGISIGADGTVKNAAAAAAAAEASFTETYGLSWLTYVPSRWVLTDPDARRARDRAMQKLFEACAELHEAGLPVSQANFFASSQLSRRLSVLFDIEDVYGASRAADGSATSESLWRDLWQNLPADNEATFPGANTLEPPTYKGKALS